MLYINMSFLTGQWMFSGENGTKNAICYVLIEPAYEIMVLIT